MHPQQLLLISLLPFLAAATPTPLTRKLTTRDLLSTRAESSSSSSSCAYISLKAKSYGRGYSDSEKIKDKEVAANGEGFFIGKETTTMCKKEGGEKKHQEHMFMERAESKESSESSSSEGSKKGSYGKEEECKKVEETSIRVENGKASMNAEISPAQQIYIDEEGKLLFSKAGEKFEEKEGTTEGFEYDSKTKELTFKHEEKEKSFWACPAEEESSSKSEKRAESSSSSEKEGEGEGEEKEEVWELFVGEPQPKKASGKREAEAEKSGSGKKEGGEKKEKEEEVEFVSYKTFQKKKCYQVHLEGEAVEKGAEKAYAYGEEEEKSE